MTTDNAKPQNAKPQNAKPQRVSVGQLAHVCRTGDINFRFSARSSAMEGIRGHRLVQQRRGDRYFAECALSIEVAVNGYAIEVHGRADGIELLGEGIRIEEIKTTRANPADVPEDVLASYWLQAMMYASIVVLQDQLPGAHLRLCLLNLDDDTEYLLDRWMDADDLVLNLADAVGRYGEILIAQQQRVQDRNRSLAGLAFPHGQFRPGQRDLAVSVYRAVTQREPLMLQAPTGLGKTLGTLYPAVQALAGRSGDMRPAARVFYVSARNATQVLVEKAVSDLLQTGARISGITITAREKICFSPGEPCDPSRCQYARGYYDRVHDAISHLLESADGNLFDRVRIEETAKQFEICPFELTLDLSEWCDVIISDYNYVFDPAVYLRRHFEDTGADSVVLVDEAHNLVDRGRSMFSASLVKEDFLAIARLMKSVRGDLARAAQRVNRELLALRNSPERVNSPERGTVNSPQPLPTGVELLEKHGHLTWRSAPPQPLIKGLQNFCDVSEILLREDATLPGKDQLLEVYFMTLRFLRTAELFDHRYVMLMQKKVSGTMLTLYCVDPSAGLQARMEMTASTICFSATLQPVEYFRQMIGSSDDCRWYRLPSPFAEENLRVVVAKHIDTSFRGRFASLGGLVELIAVMTNARQGNYLVFFPSFRYMEDAANLFRERYPETATLVQQRQMDDTGRGEYLACFEKGPVCGFAVMGSQFSEGIDLKGDRLIGVMVVGTGLPQIGIERDVIRDHFSDEGCNDGFDYAYRFPGMNRVLQTAGRVIRDAGDRGVVCLVDPRFAEYRHQVLMPEDWRPVSCDNHASVSATLKAFWSPGVDSPGVDSHREDSPGVDSPRVDSPGVDSPGVASPHIKHLA